MKKKRRLKKGHVNFISLVPRGANQLPVMYKSEGDNFTFQNLVKTMTEEGELLSIVYTPEHRDSDGDIADAEVIKQMAYDAQKAGGVDIDIRHDGKALPREDAYVAETFIVQKGDKRFEGLKDYSGNEVDPEGAWAVIIKIENEDLRKQYRDGLWNGVSMGGTGAFSIEKGEDSDDPELEGRLLSMFPGLEKMKAPKTQNPNKENTMTKEEVEKIVKEAIVASKESDNQTPEQIAKQEALEKEACLKKQGIKKPVFRGKLTDETALRKHQRDVELYQAASECDFEKAESIAEYRETVTEIKKEYADLDEQDDTQNKSGASSSFKKGEKGKSQNSDDNLTDEERVAKQEQDDAQDMADFVNEQ